MALLQILKAKTQSKFRSSCFLKSLGKVIIVVIKRTQWKERETHLKIGCNAMHIKHRVPILF